MSALHRAAPAAAPSASRVPAVVHARRDDRRHARRPTLDVACGANAGASRLNNRRWGDATASRDESASPPPPRHRGRAALSPLHVRERKRTCRKCTARTTPAAFRTCGPLTVPKLKSRVGGWELLSSRCRQTRLGCRDILARTIPGQDAHHPGHQGPPTSPSAVGILVVKLGFPSQHPQSPTQVRRRRTWWLCRDLGSRRCGGGVLRCVCVWVWIQCR